MNNTFQTPDWSGLSPEQRGILKGFYYGARAQERGLEKLQPGIWAEPFEDSTIYNVGIFGKADDTAWLFDGSSREDVSEAFLKQLKIIYSYLNI